MRVSGGAPPPTRIFASTWADFLETQMATRTPRCPGARQCVSPLSACRNQLQQQPLLAGRWAGPLAASTPYPAACTADLSCVDEVLRSSNCTVASPDDRETFTSPTPAISCSTRVTLLVQLPQVMPVTFRISVCMVTHAVARTMPAAIVVATVMSSGSVSSPTACPRDGTEGAAAPEAPPPVARVTEVAGCDREGHSWRSRDADEPRGRAQEQLAVVGAGACSDPFASGDRRIVLPSW